VTRLLKKYIRTLLEVRQQKKLRIFDFDDTLVKTNSLIHVTTATGQKFDLTPGEYAVYEQSHDEIYDYSDFQKLIDPKVIHWTMLILQYIAEAGADAIILTARSTAIPVQQFLSDAQLPQFEVISLGSSDPMAKARYIADRINKDSLAHVEFFDDSPKNIAAVKSLQKDFPQTKIVVRHVKH